MELPALTSAVNKQSLTQSSHSRKVVPLVQIQSFSQLLKNMHQIEVNGEIGVMTFKQLLIDVKHI